MRQVGTAIDQWELLETYRQRYPIDERIAPVLSLEASMKRRQSRAAALTRRLRELQDQIAQVRRELQAVDSEIEGSRSAGALLIEEILDRVRIEMGEGWSPTPVLGYRVWSIEGNRIMGNQVHWPTPELVSECLREIPGEDLPHPISRCGPPACGIYAVKGLDVFAPDVARGSIHNSMVGLVAMSGKVIEHEEGYRSHIARAVAVSATDGRRRLLTSEPAAVETLFTDPDRALNAAEPMGSAEDNPTREFLESAFAKEERWT